MRPAHARGRLPWYVAPACAILAAALGAGCRAPTPATMATPALVSPSELSAKARDPESVLRRAREAMAALHSFEAHRMDIGAEGSSTRVISADYRFERPDRHAYVVRSWWIGAPGGEIDARGASEARRIGSSYWSREDASSASGPWTCEPYGETTAPDLSSYAPPLDATFVGEEETALGKWYRFRSGVRSPESDATEWWIDPATWHVVRIEYTEEDGAAAVAYRLDAFDTPDRIVAPGPCVTATPD